MKLKNIRTASAAMLLCLGVGAQAAVITQTDSNYAFLNGTSATRTLTIGQHGTINDVNFSITFSKCDFPGADRASGQCVSNSGSFDNEIFFQLMSPTGLTIDLVSAGTYSATGNGSGIITVMFDDEATMTVGSPLASGGEAVQGSFKPVDALSIFDGMDMFGDWILTVGSVDFGDPLEYFTSVLEINGPGNGPGPGPDDPGDPTDPTDPTDPGDPGTGPQPVPEPASLALLGLGLVGVGVARRRRRR
jgi:hypothetical protein